MAERVVSDLREETKVQMEDGSIGMESEALKPFVFEAQYRGGEKELDRLQG